MISCIIATHNRGLLLPISVNSILTQTIQDFEIIIVDDASTDNTPEVVQSLQRIDNRIRYIRSDQNKGPGAARNLGIKQSRGEFIAIMDDDDASYPSRFEKQLKVMNDHLDVDLVFSSVRWVNEDGNEVGYANRSELDIEPAEMFALLYTQSNKIPNQSILARRRIFQKFLYPINPWIGEDWFLFLQLSASGTRFSVIPEYLVDIRRENSHQSLMKNTKLAHTSQRKVLQMTRKWLKENEIHRFDHLHSLALSNQLTREARCWPGSHGVFLTLRAILTCPTNSFAWQTFSWFLMKFINKTKIKLVN